MIPCAIIGILLLSSCRLLGEVLPVPATSSPSPAALPNNTPLTAVSPAMPAIVTPEPDSGWLELHPGMQRRTINLTNEQGILVETLFLLRFDPAQYRIGVGYHEVPQSLSAWQAESGALVVVNGGYYRVEIEIYIPTGLTVVDGEVIGTSYGDFAGMLAVSATGAELRWLAQKPYDPQEALTAALQSFPLLVKPGGEMGFGAEHEDNLQARRTVIAQDRSGRWVLLVASSGSFSLHRLSAYLAASDLELDIALNLDGGPSSGLLLADPYQEIPSLTPLPVVITIHPR